MGQNSYRFIQFLITLAYLAVMAAAAVTVVATHAPDDGLLRIAFTVAPVVAFLAVIMGTKAWQIHREQSPAGAR